MKGAPFLFSAINTYFLGPSVLFCSFLLFQTLFLLLFLSFQFSLFLSPVIKKKDQMRAVWRKWKITLLKSYRQQTHRCNPKKRIKWVRQELLWESFFTTRKRSSKLGNFSLSSVACQPREALTHIKTSLHLQLGCVTIS